MRVSSEQDGVLTINISALLREPSRETLLWELLKERGFSSAEVEQIGDNLDGRVGRQWMSATHQLVVDRGVVVVEPIEKDTYKAVRMPEAGTYVMADGRRLKTTIEPRTEDFAPLKGADAVSLDADKVAFPLTLRRVGDGDVFIPFGMKGRKLLSDFLTDRKLSVFEKLRQLVVADAEGKIVWVVGHRTDNRVRISDATDKVLIISILNDNM